MLRAGNCSQSLFSVHSEGVSHNCTASIQRLASMRPLWGHQMNYMESLIISRPKCYIVVILIMTKNKGQWRIKVELKIAIA